MDERLRQWRPTKDEVERIVAEMRPIIRALADQERSAMAPLDEDRGLRRPAAVLA